MQTTRRKEQEEYSRQMENFSGRKAIHRFLDFDTG